MLKQFLTTAAVVALMAGPAYAQSDQAGKGKADGSATTSSSTMEKSDSGSTSGATGTAGSTATQSGSGATTSTDKMATGQDKSDSTSSGSSMSSSTGSGSKSGSSSMSASTDKPAAGSTETFLTDQSAGQWRAEKLIGADVKNSQDEDIGKIDDLVFSEDGKIQAAVVSVGGFLGIGAKNVAVSWDQLQVRSSDAGEEIMVPLSKEQLENAPPFKTLEDKKSEEAAANAKMQQGTTAPSGGMKPTTR